MFSLGDRHTSLRTGVAMTCVILSFFDRLRKGVPIRHALVDYTIHFPINGMRRSSAARVREMANTTADSTGTLQTGSQVST